MLLQLTGMEFPKVAFGTLAHDMTAGREPLEALLLYRPTY